MAACNASERRALGKAKTASKAGTEECKKQQGCPVDWKEMLKKYKCPRDLSGDIKWRQGKPNYAKANEKYIRQKTRQHASESLENVVEGAVKNFEMELSHKLVAKQFNAIPLDFTMSSNTSKAFSLEECIKMGSYNAILDQTKGWKPQSFEKTHQIWRKTFKSGFAWEVLKVFTAPPTVHFSWRHWGHLGSTTLNEESKGKGKLVELFGFTIATVNDKLQLTTIKNYFDDDKFMKDVKMIKE